MDILAVAVHYSNRYGSSEEYILSKSCGNPKLERILFLKDKTKLGLVTDFISKKIILVDDQTLSIGWNEMYYIWKIYFDRVIFVFLLILWVAYGGTEKEKGRKCYVRAQA